MLSQRHPSPGAGTMVQATLHAPAAAASPSRNKQFAGGKCGRADAAAPLDEEAAAGSDAARAAPPPEGAHTSDAPNALKRPQHQADTAFETRGGRADETQAPEGPSTANRLRRGPPRETAAPRALFAEAPPDDEGRAAAVEAIARSPTPTLEDEEEAEYFYPDDDDDDDDDDSDAEEDGNDAVLAQELAERFAMEDLQEQRRELLGGLALTLVARANAASRAVASPRQLVRHRELLAQVSESMDLLHSLMPALEASGMIQQAAQPARPDSHKGLLPHQVDDLKRCRGRDRPRVSKCLEHEDDDACAICLCEIESDEEVIALPCRHSYHAQCVGDWLQRSPTCPSCSLNVAEALDIELAPTRDEQQEMRNRARLVYFPTREELEDEQEEFRHQLDSEEDDDLELMRQEEELLQAEEEELQLRAERDDMDDMLHRAEDQMLRAERELAEEELAEGALLEAARERERAEEELLAAAQLD